LNGVDLAFDSIVARLAALAAYQSFGGNPGLGLDCSPAAAEHGPAGERSLESGERQGSQQKDPEVANTRVPRRGVRGDGAGIE
jgi:hypothetical protein